MCFIILNDIGTTHHNLLGISVRDEFRLGGLFKVSCPSFFFQLLAQKSSGFAHILLDILPENGYLKNSRGGGGGYPIRLNSISTAQSPSFVWDFKICDPVYFVWRPEACLSTVFMERRPLRRNTVFAVARIICVAGRSGTS